MAIIVFWAALGLAVRGAGIGGTLAPAPSWPDFIWGVLGTLLDPRLGAPAERRDDIVDCVDKVKVKVNHPGVSVSLPLAGRPAIFNTNISSDMLKIFYFDLANNNDIIVSMSIN